MKTINFSRVDKAKFFRTLNKRVNTYFKENNIKRTGNWKLYSKAVVMFSLFLVVARHTHARNKITPTYHNLQIK